MQNYIISRKNDEVETGRDAVLIKDKTVVETFREKERGRTKERKRERTGLGRTVAGIGVVCAVSLGALWYISPLTVDGIRDTILGRNSSGEVQVFMNNSDAENGGKMEQTSLTNGQKITDKSNYTDGSTQQEGTTITSTPLENDSVTTANDGSTTENDTADQTDEGQMVYTVEAGDTLVSIAIKMYGDQTKAEYIASVNSLDIDTPIYEGQKIVIPYIE